MKTNINIPEYKVSQFNQIFKDVVESNFDYIRIRGEISELKNASSGHVYLTLKDETSILNATLWKHKKEYLNLKPEVGMEVIVTGKISTYAKSISTYSINIDKFELAGEGALLKMIEDRKKKLEKEGYFKKEHKKNIPYLPRKIGVITSSSGAVIYDIINCIKDRFPIDIDVWPVQVQGVNAVDTIILAIDGFNSINYINRPDVIIIARGGGSTEDLMAFNDEALAKSVYDSAIPIISAIGHETDTTIIDYVSDLRASTPTAAAEKISPSHKELTSLVFNIIKKMDYFFSNKIKNTNSDFYNLSKYLKSPENIINSYKQRFNYLNESLSKKLKENYTKKTYQLNYIFKLIKSPDSYIKFRKTELKNNLQNLDRNLNNKKDTYKKELNKFLRLLESNSIHKNLQKGYVVIKKTNKIINKSTQFNNKDILNIQFIDKSIKANIKKIN